MLHLLLGRAKTGKTTRLYQAMRENGKHRPQVLIVPEQYSHEAERRLCQELGGGASAWAEVLSFTRLYHRVLTETSGLAQPMLDGGGQLPDVADGLLHVDPPLLRRGLSLGADVRKLRYHRARASGRRLSLARYRGGRGSACRAVTGAKPSRRPDEAVFYWKCFILKGLE